MLASDKINLSKVNFLLIANNFHFQEILAQVIRAFGVRNITRCSSVPEAKSVLKENLIDFILTDSHLAEESGYDFLEWLRRHANEANRFTPAIIVTGHTRISQIARARDCGAHFTIAKPVTPKVMLDRIAWIGRETRMFIETDNFCGLDRRFRTDGAPAGMKGRRADDPDQEFQEAEHDDLTVGMLDPAPQQSKVAS